MISARNLQWAQAMILDFQTDGGRVNSAKPFFRKRIADAAYDFLAGLDHQQNLANKIHSNEAEQNRHPGRHKP